jgi:hypothetical protein
VILLNHCLASDENGNSVSCVPFGHVNINCDELNVLIEHVLDGRYCKRINLNKTKKFCFSLEKKSSVYNFSSFLTGSDVIVLAYTQKGVDWLVIKLE